MIVLSRGVSLFLLLMLVVMLHTELSISDGNTNLYAFIPFALVYLLPLFPNSILVKIKVIIIMAFVVSVFRCLVNVPCSEGSCRRLLFRN